MGVSDNFLVALTHAVPLKSRTQEPDPYNQQRQILPAVDSNYLGSDGVFRTEILRQCGRISAVVILSTVFDNENGGNAHDSYTVALSSTVKHSPSLEV